MGLLEALIMIGLIATIASLVLGLRSMSRGGEYDRQHSEQFMWARVGFQGVTLLVLLIAFWVLL